MCAMPYKDPEKQRAAVRAATARWYEKVKDDPEHILKRLDRDADRVEARGRAVSKARREDAAQDALAALRAAEKTINDDETK